MTRKKKAGHVCAARNYNNKQYLSKESFFSFPKQQERAMKWTVACSREDLLGKLESLNKSYRLCGAHFENKMFLNDMKNRLQAHAIPTIFVNLEGSVSISNDHKYSFFTQKHTSTPISEKVPVNSNVIQAVTDRIAPNVKGKILKNVCLDAGCYSDPVPRVNTLNILSHPGVINDQIELKPKVNILQNIGWNKGSSNEQTLKTLTVDVQNLENSFLPNNISDLTPNHQESTR